MKIRNAAFNRFGTIDCEIEHPKHGWIPFTASPDDPEKLGRDVHAVAIKMGVEAYVAPPPRPPENIMPTTDQFKAALKAIGFTDEQLASFVAAAAKL
jgi:hypothetical protein